MILTFTWTTNELLSGKKTCTRRRWKDKHAADWLRACNSGRWIHQAWDKMPFTEGAKKLADIRLLQLPYQERLADMPDSDLEAEGGLWADKAEFLAQFGDPEQLVWVVRFELVEASVGAIA